MSPRTRPADRSTAVKCAFPRSLARTERGRGAMSSAGCCRSDNGPAATAPLRHSRFPRQSARLSPRCRIGPVSIAPFARSGRRVHCLGTRSAPRVASPSTTPIDSAPAAALKGPRERAPRYGRLRRQALALALVTPASVGRAGHLCSGAGTIGMHDAFRAILRPGHRFCVGCPRGRRTQWRTWR